MPLIKCAECGKEFSDLAEACPGCSCPRDRIRSCGECGTAMLDTADAWAKSGRNREGHPSAPSPAPPVIEKPEQRTAGPVRSGKARRWRVLVVAAIGVAAVVVAVKYPYKSSCTALPVIRAGYTKGLGCRAVLQGVRAALSAWEPAPSKNCRERVFRSLGGCRLRFLTRYPSAALARGSALLLGDSR